MKRQVTEVLLAAGIAVAVRLPAFAQAETTFEKPKLSCR
jgi:hypothetical protein